MKKKNLNVIIVTTAIIMTVIAIVVIVGLCIPERKETIQGQAETTDYRVSSKIPARILEIRVSEGDAVAKGDTLVVLEAPDIAAKLASGRSRIRGRQGCGAQSSHRSPPRADPVGLRTMAESHLPAGKLPKRPTTGSTACLRAE